MCHNFFIWKKNKWHNYFRNHMKVNLMLLDSACWVLMKVFSLYSYLSVSYNEYLLSESPFISVETTFKRIIKNKDDGFKKYQIKKWILYPFFNVESYAFQSGKFTHLTLFKIKCDQKLSKIIHIKWDCPFNREKIYPHVRCW